VLNTLFGLLYLTIKTSVCASMHCATKLVSKHQMSHSYRPVRVSEQVSADLEQIMQELTHLHAARVDRRVGGAQPIRRRQEVADGHDEELAPPCVAGVPCQGHAAPP
jgi:hypothetical protein